MLFEGNLIVMFCIAERFSLQPEKVFRKDEKYMNKRSCFWIIFILLLLICLNSCNPIAYRKHKIPPLNAQFEQQIKSLYQDCMLNGKLRYDVFQKALQGHSYLTFKNPDIITIIDYSRPSTDKRCFVIDIEKRVVLYNTFIAHGKNSGENYATVFSNIENSKQSSLGFFQTSDTYMGSNGYSIELDGLEKSINHLARKREIVIHGADYVSQQFIDENGRLGRSWGCPAFPKDVSTEIIDVIKGQSCVYIYADDKDYLSKSNYIPDDMDLVL